MQSGNGIDLAAVYQLLSEVAQTVRGHSERFDQIERGLKEIVATVNRHGRTLDQLVSVVNDHSPKIDDLTAGLGELRLRVDQIHASVIGHGLDISEVTERLKLLETPSGSS